MWDFPLAGSLAVTVAVIVTATAAAGERPNVVVILADDLGYGDLSCYGAGDVQTPSLDALARRGLRFENFYANSTVCSPTRASLLTGRYPDRVGVPGVIRTHAENNWGWLDPAVTTLADRFRSAGYQTAIVGKWHLGLETPNLPNERGFDLFAGFLGDMMDDYRHHRRHDVNYMRRNGEVIEPTGHATDLFSEWACDFFKSADADRPFFLYLAYNAPHSPIQPPDEWLDRVRQRRPDLSDARSKMVALIEHLDAGIGLVLDTLESQRLAERTIVVFTSDNGGAMAFGASNAALRDGKQSMYEGGLKVPAIVAWPGTIEAGRTTAYMAQTMDLVPTLLQAAGVDFDHDEFDGRTFVPTLAGQDQPPLRDEWYFVRREGGPYGGKTIEAVRKGDWKLVWNDPFGPPQLFHLARDPGETNDVIAVERAVADELRSAMMRHIQAGGTVPWQRPHPPDVERSPPQ